MLESEYQSQDIYINKKVYFLYDKFDNVEEKYIKYFIYQIFYLINQISRIFIFRVTIQEVLQFLVKFLLQ